MCWLGQIHGREIILWFNVGETINQEVYMNMLKKDI